MMYLPLHFFCWVTGSFSELAFFNKDREGGFEVFRRVHNIAKSDC
jgi:hypothetical protein